MSSRHWRTSVEHTVTQTVSPEEHAALVAGDRHLAAQVYHFCVLGDTSDAVQIVSDEADEILALCTYMPVTSAIGANQSLIEAMRSIEDVRSDSTRRGDAIQAMWCRMLNHRLEVGF
jgi:hypothetical protein